MIHFAVLLDTLISLEVVIRRCSLNKVFFKIVVLKNFAILTGKTCIRVSFQQSYNLGTTS